MVEIDDNIVVKMEKDLSVLDEVVVIGYGTQKLSDISGSVSTVNSDVIESSSPVRVEDAIQGQASGINIISSGSPGSKPTVLIRGITSYAGNDPLVVIDGVSASIDDLNSLRAISNFLTSCFSDPSLRILTLLFFISFPPQINSIGTFDKECSLIL